MCFSVDEDFYLGADDDFNIHKKNVHQIVEKSLEPENNNNKHSHLIVSHISFVYFYLNFAKLIAIRMINHSLTKIEYQENSRQSEYNVE